MTFNDFWKAYPKKVGKLAAQKAWAKASKIEDPKQIIAGIAPYVEHKPDWQDYCHPATWLNQGRWMDEYEVPSWQTKPVCCSCKQPLGRSTIEGMHPQCYDEHTSGKVAFLDRRAR